MLLHSCTSPAQQRPSPALDPLHPARQVDTIDGKAECIVPPCTMNGAQLRMARKGVPDVRTGMRGDQIVHIQVVGPKSLSDKQRQLLHEFEAEEQAKGGAGKGSSGAGKGSGGDGKGSSGDGKGSGGDDKGSGGDGKSSGGDDKGSGGDGKSSGKKGWFS
jgi:hypothetical protein